MEKLSARPGRDVLVSAHLRKLARAIGKQPPAGSMNCTAFLSLELTEEARELTAQFLRRGLIPAKAIEDAFHIAIATVQGMEYLLTWNCTHIANAEIMGRFAELCDELGYEMPILCTPEQLMGE